MDWVQKMNNNDIFQKSDLGREKIRNKDLVMLPREARTLLFLIDGKKTYASYLESFNNNRVFAEFGGVALFFELLQDLAYIEVVGQARSTTAPSSSIMPEPSPSSVANAPQMPEASQASKPQAHVMAETPSQNYNQAEFLGDWSNHPHHSHPKKASILDKFFRPKEKGTVVNYETLKSDLATYIEEHALMQDAWGYLLSLEKCESEAQLLALVQAIQQSTAGELSSGMDKYIKALSQ